MQTRLKILSLWLTGRRGKKMNKQQKIDRIQELTRINQRYGQRRGQAVMNALFEVAPEVYRIINGTENDPFYNDKNLGFFWTSVYENIKE